MQGFASLRLIFLSLNQNCEGISKNEAGGKIHNFALIRQFGGLFFKQLSDYILWPRALAKGGLCVRAGQIVYPLDFI